MMGMNLLPCGTVCTPQRFIYRLSSKGETARFSTPIVDILWLFDVMVYWVTLCSNLFRTAVFHTSYFIFFLTPRAIPLHFISSRLIEPSRRADGSATSMSRAYDLEATPAKAMTSSPCISSFQYCGEKEKVGLLAHSVFHSTYGIE